MRLALVLFTLVITGCNSMEGASGAANLHSNEIVQFCEIAKDPEPFLDRLITMQAKYTVVKNYDSYFSSLNCDAVKSIAEGSRRLADSSVANFYRAGDQLCSMRNTKSLCTLHADVTIVVRINVDDEGELVADPVQVKNFRYLP